MDAEYILPHLLKWAKLFYSKDKKGGSRIEYCYAIKKGKYYEFGWKKKDKGECNLIGKPLAMYLSIGEIPKLKKKKK